MDTSKKIIIGILIVVCFSSCVQDKYFYKCNKLNTIKAGNRDNNGRPKPPDTLVTFKPPKHFRGKLKESDDYTIIVPNKDSDLIPYRNEYRDILKRPTDSYKMLDYNSQINSLKDKYFVPIVIKDTVDIGKIVYFDSKPVLQTLSTPIKIRPALTDPALKDSFPSQVTTDVNLGISFGWKFTVNFYKPRPNLFDSKTTAISLTPGIFYGMAATSLTAANTRNPTVTIERDALTHTLGFFAMFGFNNINIGYTVGWDFVTGPNKSSWVYQGKIWHGIALSLDLIK
ncbi:hypothetical protein [Ferruginibacter albus]|uniref:hypothetical protein n=1 Tax=Ferruginibacter albus TaxID=2875540 RepID=UPI001CC478B8|nr:hypothetical protein [Ferruginibacter albus]UAY52126.1 hypothetical protein K9M53_00180 [Ferruginibacter albus]